MDATKDAVLGWVNAYFPNKPAATFESLNDGYHFYRLLAGAANYCFSEEEENIPRTENWILKKTNLSTLIRDMSRFGTVFLKATDSFDLTASNTLPPIDAIAKGSGEGAVEGLIELSEYVVTMAALSGNKSIIDNLRTVSKERQSVLNSTIKRIMTLHGFKKAVPPTTSAATAKAAALSSNSNVMGSHSKNDTLISPTSAGSGLTIRASDDIRSNDDPAVLRGELNVLRNELRDKTSALDTAESKCNVAEQQLEQLQARHRLLLEQHESKGTSAKERELQQALTSLSTKEKQIQELNSIVRDMEVKHDTLKRDRRTFEEDLDKAKAALDAEKKRTKDLISEKSEIINQLSLAQEKLSLAQNKREELEKELLKKEVTERNSDLLRRATSEALGSSGSAIAVEGLGNVTSEDISSIVRDLRAKLQAAESEVAMLRRVEGGNTSSHTDDENMSNTSIAQAPGTRIGDASSPSGAFVGDTSFAGANAAEVAELKAQLSEAQRSISSLEAKLTEQVEAHKSELATAQLKIKQAEDEGATRGTAALETEIADLRAESEKNRRSLAEKAQNEELLKAQAARQVEAIEKRLEDGRKAMQAEQAVVTSVVFHCGQRNLALQQRGLLGGAAVPHAFKDEGFSGLFRQSAATSGRSKGGAGYSRGAADDEMAVAAGGAESFMSSARLAGLWGNMKAGGVQVASGSSGPAKRR